MNGLIINNVGVRYGPRTVLKDFTLPELCPGEVTVLAGPNAAGKSTALRAIAQMLPHHGDMSLDGENLAHMPFARRAQVMGFMPQSLPTGVSLNAIESVIAAFRAGHASPAQGADEKAMDTLARLGIEALALEPLNRLSGGQRQMVGLAQAIVRDPKLLLLDEPTSALDLSRQMRLLSEIRRLASEGRIVILVMHDLALAARWADRIALVHDGKIHSQGPPDKVVTPTMIAEVYGVSGRIERCSHGHIMVMIDGEIGSEIEGQNETPRNGDERA